MEIFKNPQVDWLGKRTVLVGLSLALLMAGLASVVFKGLHLGLDFTGGTLVYVKFKNQPQLDRIRRTLTRAGLRAEEVTRYDVASKHEIQIRMAQVANGQAQRVGLEGSRVFETFRAEFDGDQRGKGDLNNLSRLALSSRLQESDPENLRQQRSIAEFTSHYDEIAAQIADYRNQQGGLVGDFSELQKLGLSTAAVKTLQEKFYLGSFTVISMESVGPKVGRELQTRARNAIIFSLIGMLIYIAFRFRPIYGLAAVVALFHDVFITLGIFSLTNQEITLTVVAALLTLVGYSINDTIVIFDRIRENSRVMRRADLTTIINASINQTLNRTVMTSGMTFLAVFSLYLFGGQVLNGFSLALVVGIIIGTYSTLAVASPIVLWWQNFSERRKARA